MTLFGKQHLKKPGRKGRRKWLVLPAAMILTGMITEYVCEYMERQAYQPVGEIYTVNGHDMHIWSDGEGDETVVFSAGWGFPCPYTDFYPLHSEIVKSARVAVYDRPGHGWSEVAETDREIDIITEELHQLLIDSGQKAPYILVGHSIASLEVLRFAQLYPDEVKGVVLIDGSYPGMYEHITVSETGYLLTDLRNYGIRTLNRTGVTRLLFNTLYPYQASPLGSGRAGLKAMPEELMNLEKAMFFKTFYNPNQIAEVDHKRDNAAVVMEAGNIGSIPLIVITSEIMDSYEESSANQKRMLSLSTDSRQVPVAEARHFIHWYAPEAVNAEILSLTGD